MSGIDTIAAYLAGALETIEHLEEEMKDVLTRMQSLQSENSGLKERVTQLERRHEPRHEPRKITVGEYLGLEVRVLNEDRGISEILFPNGSRIHVESSMVKRGGGSLLLAGVVGGAANKHLTHSKSLGKRGLARIGWMQRLTPPPLSTFFVLMPMIRSRCKGSPIIAATSSPSPTDALRHGTKASRSLLGKSSSSSPTIGSHRFTGMPSFGARLNALRS